jgi:serine/threonine protein kinase
MSMTRGRQLIGKEIGSCLLEKLLGYGGSSAVYLAQQQGVEQKVAIKVFLPRSTMNLQMRKDFYARFLREAEAVSNLDHANILPIYSYGEQDGLPYIIMPYMPGGTLREYITSHGRLSLAEAQWYLKQIAAALDYAHEQGCVHCDVKPANILLDGAGNVQLSDFGIVHMMPAEANPAHPQQPAAKVPGMLLGTPDYISPEQAMGKPLDGRSDIYSLGITLFTLLAGRPPFNADSTIAMALLHVHEPPPSLSLLRADISPTTDHVIQKALAKLPEARYQTAGALSAAFSEAIANDRIELMNGQQQMVPARKNGNAPHYVSNSGTKRVLLNNNPVVRIKPASQRRVNFPRVFIAIGALLVVAMGAAVLGGLLTSRFDGSTAKQVQAKVPANALIDDLSNSGDWPTGGTFFFANKQYHIENKSAQYVALVYYANHTYANFRLTVTMAEQQGKEDGADYYGIVFRSTSDQSHYYLFEVSSWEGGLYQFLRYDSNTNTKWKSLSGGSTPVILNPQSKTNTITIEATGNTFHFWINNVPISKPLTDTNSGTPISSGNIGFSVEEQGTEVAFSHLYITALHNTATKRLLHKS